MVNGEWLMINDYFSMVNGGCQNPERIKHE